MNLKCISFFRRSPQAENHRAATEGCGVGPGVLGLGGEGGGSTLAGVSYRRPGTQSGHEGNRTLQEGYQPWRSVWTFGTHTIIYVCSFFNLQHEQVDQSAFIQNMTIKILKHQFLFFNAGYYGDGLNAIIVFAVCFMPESNQPNYRYIMDNLFK